MMVHISVNPNEYERINNLVQKLNKQNAKLREALQKIADDSLSSPDDNAEFARDVLEQINRAERHGENNGN